MELFIDWVGSCCERHFFSAARWIAAQPIDSTRMRPDERSFDAARGMELGTARPWSRGEGDRYASLLSPSPSPLDGSLMQRVAAFFGASESAITVHCQVCLEHVHESDSVALSACGHRFCRPCLTMFLAMNIHEGQVYPKCFYQNKSEEQETATACGVLIAPSDIELLVAEETLEKYRRFRFNQENKFARQCPYCDSSLRCRGPEHPECRCLQCGKTFCFIHANAHVGRSCEAYEKDQAKIEQETRTIIDRISKECPQCKTKIEKDGGCNHVKCSRCGTNFCWMCGTIIEDSDLPNHYQWWNLGGCAGLMRADIRQETTFQRVVAKFLSILNFIFVGPASFILTVALTIATLGCLPCLCCGDMSFRETFLLGMELMAWILLSPISLTIVLFRKTKQCFQKQEASTIEPTVEPPPENSDPSQIV